MKKQYILVILIQLCALTGWGQHRVVAEVKKNIGELTMTINSYQAAINKIKPALSNDETKNDPEAWYVAGKAYFGLYDKHMGNKSIGKKVDAKAMGDALLEGYNCFMQSLKRDTIYEIDKKGNQRIDKKTGKPKMKTRFSSDIVDRLSKHFQDFNVMGGELYNIKQWDDAYRAWQIYLDINANPQFNVFLPDGDQGLIRYYQGIALWQKGDNAEAAKHFAMARTLGYTKKEAYDYALVCLSSVKDEQGIVELAHEAYQQFGISDPQYARILINDYINNKQLDKAGELLDKVMVEQPDDAELQNLKGLVVEQQEGLEKAFPYFKRSVELDGNNAQSLFNLGRYYYNEAARTADANPKLSARALARKVNPIYREALPYLEKAYELDPSNTDTLNALRNIYYKLGDGKRLEALEGKK